MGIMIPLLIWIRSLTHNWLLFPGRTHTPAASQPRVLTSNFTGKQQQRAQLMICFFQVELVCFTSFSLPSTNFPLGRSSWYANATPRPVKRLKDELIRAFVPRRQRHLGRKGRMNERSPFPRIASVNSQQCTTSSAGS